MAPFAVIYRYSTEVTRSDEHRQAHRDYLGSLFDAGKLSLVGRLGEAAAADAPPSALVIMNCESRDEVEQLLDGDPYYQNGLIVEREIRSWNILYGSIS